MQKNVNCRPRSVLSDLCYTVSYIIIYTVSIIIFLNFEIFLFFIYTTVIFGQDFCFVSIFFSTSLYYQFYIYCIFFSISIFKLPKSVLSDKLYYTFLCCNITNNLIYQISVSKIVCFFLRKIFKYSIIRLSPGL